MSQILGIYLVKNEEYFTAWSLMNVVNFCDKIIFLDNCSNDRTGDIAKSIAAQHSHIEIIKVPNANNTQKYLQPYFGTSTWVLGVDGDEIHDPHALLRLRKRLLDGEFENYWSISSRYCHVTEFDFEQSTCKGYTQPEAKAGLKLYNFNAIDNWISKWRKRERLHGPGRKFRSGYSEDSRYEFHTVDSWDNSDFRCLHLCFFPRSSQELKTQKFLNQTPNRKNPAESRPLRRFTRAIERFHPKTQDYRTKRYALGPLRSFDIRFFKKPDDYQEFDPNCEAVMQVLSERKSEIKH